MRKLISELSGACTSTALQSSKSVGEWGRVAGEVVKGAAGKGLSMHGRAAERWKPHAGLPIPAATLKQVQLPCRTCKWQVCVAKFALQCSGLSPSKKGIF